MYIRVPTKGGPWVLHISQYAKGTTVVYQVCNTTHQSKKDPTHCPEINMCLIGHGSHTQTLRANTAAKRAESLK